MAQKLASTLGIGVGISSGANLIGAIKVQNMLGSSSTVVTVFPDDNKKYLSTDLMKSEPLKDGFISKDVELVGIKAMKRTCYTCCNPELCKNLVFPEEMLPCPKRKCNFKSMEWLGHFHKHHHACYKIAWWLFFSFTLCSPSCHPGATMLVYYIS